MLSKSDKLQQLAQGYLDAGSPSNMSNTVLTANPNTPASMLDFSAPGTGLPTQPPSYVGGKTFVPGVGLLGADLGGAVKGSMLRQQYSLDAAKNNRDEQTIGIAKTKLAQDQDYITIAKAQLGLAANEASNKQLTFDQQQTIQQGMVQAAQNGGYPAVIDYLKTADPAKAIEFQANKLQLDAGMMANETYKTAHENDKAQAILQGYSLLGGIGASLMKLPADQRQEAYETTYAPIAKQLDPNMPDKLNGTAVSKLMLGMTLSTPAAILYDAKKQANNYQSQIGNQLQDYNTAVATKGADSSDAKIFSQAINNTLQQANKNQLQIASTIAQNQANGESSLRNQWLQNTKDIAQMAQSNSAVQQASQSVKQKDGTIKGPDDMAIIYNYYKMLDPTSVIMPGEYANAENTAGWSDQMRKTYNHIQSGDKLSKNQRNAFSKSAELLYENKAQSYYSLKSQFEDIATRNNYNPKNITVDKVEAYLPTAPAEAINDLINDPSPEKQKEFQLKYGQDAKNKALSQAQQQQGSAQ